MDAQLKRGILEACVLSTLEKGESYGYKLVNDISSFMPITESTLYPILKRLGTQGFVNSRTEEYNGRLRKYYSITDEGRQRVTELLLEWEEIVKVYQYIENERG